MSAKVVLDSVSPDGDRLTTMEVRFHRFVLAEFNTHRVFSRNSASSRAIPVTKQLERLMEDPAYPVEYRAEQPGMQGGGLLNVYDEQTADALWNEIRDFTVAAVTQYIDETTPEQRAHKSLLNRLLEPFMWHTVIVSSTEWENFFSQRCSPLAQPEIRVAAEEMRTAYRMSEPEETQRFDWHTPYIQPDEWDLCQTDKIKVSAARCARVSYLTHDGNRSIDKDLELFDRLVSAEPPHWSPLEHVARPASVPDEVVPGNYTGWQQLRHLW